MFGSDRECQWVFGVSANAERGARHAIFGVMVQSYSRGTQIVFRSCKDKTADQAADNLETVLQLHMEERTDRRSAGVCSMKVGGFVEPVTGLTLDNLRSVMM